MMLTEICEDKIVVIKFMGIVQNQNINEMKMEIRNEKLMKMEIRNEMNGNKKLEIRNEKLMKMEIRKETLMSLLYCTDP